MHRNKSANKQLYCDHALFQQSMCAVLGFFEPLPAMLAQGLYATEAHITLRHLQGNKKKTRKK